jgi:hypothetical protein
MMLTNRAGKFYKNSVAAFHQVSTPISLKIIFQGYATERFKQINTL